MLLIKRVRKIKVKINFFTLSAMLALCIAVAIPVHAALLTGPISGTAIQGSSGNLFLPNDSVSVDNGSTEFTSVVDTTSLPERAYANFDFYEDAGELYLIVNFASFFGATTYTVDDFTVTFSDILHTTSGNYLSNIEIAPWVDGDINTPEIETPGASYLDGVSFAPGVNVGTSFSISFDDFYSPDYSRYVELHLVFSNDGDDPNTSVVPVPAAAPMALLGLGVLVLARRFRRAKS